MSFIVKYMRFIWLFHYKQQLVNRRNPLKGLDTKSLRQYTYILKYTYLSLVQAQKSHVWIKMSTMNMEFILFANAEFRKNCQKHPASTYKSFNSWIVLIDMQMDVSECQLMDMME